MSPKDVLIETQSRKPEFPYVWYSAGTPTAIPIYTVQLYCVIIITQYDSTVYTSKKGGYRDGVKRKRDKTGMDYTHGAVR